VDQFIYFMMAILPVRVVGVLRALAVLNMLPVTSPAPSSTAVFSSPALDNNRFWDLMQVGGYRPQLSSASGWDLHDVCLTLLSRSQTVLRSRPDALS